LQWQAKVADTDELLLKKGSRQVRITLSSVNIMADIVIRFQTVLME